MGYKPLPPEYSDPLDLSAYYAGYHEGYRGWGYNPCGYINAYSRGYWDGCSDNHEHEWTEGVGDDGKLIEPPYDICIHCGERRD